MCGRAVCGYGFGVTFDKDLVAAVVAVLGVVAALVGPVANLTRANRMYQRMRRSLDLLRDLPEGQHPHLREQLERTVAFCADELAAAEPKWRVRRRAEYFRARLASNALLAILVGTVAWGVWAEWQGIQSKGFATWFAETLAWKTALQVASALVAVQLAALALRYAFTLATRWIGRTAARSKAATGQQSPPDHVDAEQSKVDSDQRPPS